MKGGGWRTDLPVPNIRISARLSELSTRMLSLVLFLPGFGTTTSKISNCSLLQASHNGHGVSHRKTLPSKNIHEEGRMRPSCSSIPAGVIPRTWTGGAGPPPRMLWILVGEPLRAICVDERARRIGSAGCRRALEKGTTCRRRLRDGVRSMLDVLRTS